MTEKGLVWERQKKGDEGGRRRGREGSERPGVMIPYPPRLGGQMGRD